MIEKILPTEVGTAWAASDPPEATLFPEEEALVAKAVAKRRAEFTTGRWCARRALAQLGQPAVAIGSGPKREPLWPAGFVGTITHCAGYRAAAVARTDVLRSLGIDAEPDAPLPEGVLDSVSLPEERAWLAEQTDAEIHFDRLLFCMKEAVYKAWFPLTGRWLGFEDARISIDPITATFEAQLLPADSPLERFEGRYLAENRLLLAAIAVTG
ncbi:4'-phosphopantetheinyl transferase superfamily protein [Pseudonocardiaceae bacterium YIM PH 21723]|nr:4'-phosphopantetheinyl transferase superfamily protein [Pseudonocardiaceae bacterium YIM PH 21723]